MMAWDNRMSLDEENLARRLIEVLRSSDLSVDSSAWMRHPPGLRPDPTPAPSAKPPRETYAEKLERLQRQKEERLSRSKKAADLKKQGGSQPMDPYVLPPGHSALCIPHTGFQEPKPFAEALQHRVRNEVHPVLWVHVSNHHVFVSAQTPKPLRILVKAHEMLR